MRIFVSKQIHNDLKRNMVLQLDSSINHDTSLVLVTTIWDLSAVLL